MPQQAASLRITACSAEVTPVSGVSGLSWPHPPGRCARLQIAKPAHHPAYFQLYRSWAAHCLPPATHGPCRRHLPPRPAAESPAEQRQALYWQVPRLRQGTGRARINRFVARALRTPKAAKVRHCSRSSPTRRRCRWPEPPHQKWQSGSTKFEARLFSCGDYPGIRVLLLVGKKYCFTLASQLYPAPGCVGVVFEPQIFWLH